MKNYNYTQQLEKIWHKAVELYRSEQRGSDTYFDASDTAFLAANGITAQEIYDFVEDFVRGGDPDLNTFLLITDVRRAYFIEKMQGQVTGKSVDPATYPAKTEEVDGIVWLPRLIEKAKVKLRGELDLDTMYGCGGDRRFFQTHDIHPAEFLRFVAAHENDDRAVIEWVKTKSAATNS